MVFLDFLMGLRDMFARLCASFRFLNWGSFLLGGGLLCLYFGIGFGHVVKGGMFSVLFDGVVCLSMVRKVYCVGVR